jgi:hypothetical protein
MAYDSYRDSNGVRWTIGPPTGWNMAAWVLPDADPRYEPQADDQQASMPPNYDGNFTEQPGGTPPTGDQQRVIFTELTTAIEAYAKAHRGNTLLQVTASPPVPWWVWAGLLYLLTRRR